MRRTRESITNEYNKFKGLKAEINKLKASPDYEKVDKKIKKVLDKLSERETCLEALSKLEENEENKKEIERNREKLRENDSYFANISDRNQCENLFKHNVDEVLYKNDAWHKAYNAFMLTDMFSISYKIDYGYETNERLQKNVDEVKKEFEDALAKERVGNPSLNAKELLNNINSLKSQKKNLSKEISENKEAYTKAKKEFNTLDSNLKNYEEQSKRVQLLSQDEMILDNVVKTMTDKFIPLESKIKEARDRRNKLDWSLWRPKQSFEQKDHEFSDLYNSYDKNYAKGNNYNESVRLTNEYFGLYFAVSGMKIRLMDKNDKKEEVKVGEVKLEQFSEIDFYRKKFKIIAEKRNMEYADVLKLNLGDYEKIVDEIRQSNLDKIKGISDRLEPADKEMFEKIDAGYVKLKNEANEIFDQYCKDVDEYNKLNKEIPELENNHKSLSKSLANDVAKIKSTYIRPSMIEAKDLSEFEKRLERMKSETKEVNTINENYQNAKNAYDDFEKSSNGQLIKTYEKNEVDLKKVKEELDKNLKVKEKMKNIKEIIDKYNKAVKKQKENRRDYNRNAIAIDLAFVAENLYKNNTSYQRKGHENSTEFNRMTGMLQTVSQYANAKDKDVNKFIKDLNNLKDAADKYLVKKNEQHRLFPTAQRRFRLEYAEWLKEFATLAQEELQREVISKDASSKQDLSKKTAETKTNEIVEQEEMEAYDALDSMDSM